MNDDSENTNDLSTKEKILTISHKLFAENGFNGVSIREIAKQSEVNIAAINYHFKNKSNLYLQTIKSSMDITENAIQQIFNNLDSKDIEFLAVEVYEYLKENSQDLKTTFKLVISGEGLCDSLGDNDIVFEGPPGGNYFHQCLAQEFPNANESDLLWGVRTLFTQVIHKAIMSCNTSICEHLHKLGGDEDILKLDIIRLVKIIRRDLEKVD